MDSYKAYLVFHAILAACCGLVPFVVGDAISYFKTFNNKGQRKDQKKKQRRTRSNRLSGFLGGIRGAITDKTNFYLSCLSRIVYGGSMIKFSKSMYTDDQKQEIKNSIDRQAEVIADKFPDIYGYAIANSSIHVKFTDINRNKVYQKLKNSRHAVKNFEYQKELFDMNDFDEHPNTVQRILSNLSSLEREYAKKDLDPKVKAELKYQIDEIKKILDDITDDSKKMTNIDKAQAVYFKYIREECPESISRELEDNIEDMLDAALEKTEKDYNKRK
jgi:hypothetical protein